MKLKSYTIGIGALCVLGLTAVAQDQYAGDIYWSSQSNDGYAFGDDPQFSRYVDGVMTAFTGGNQIDWANCDVYLDAQFTNVGVNYINAAVGTMTMKSLTVANNWDGSGTWGGNKMNLWFGSVIGGNGGNTGTMNITGAFTINSAISFQDNNQSLTLNVGNILIDVPTTPEGRSRSVRLRSYQQITTVNDFVGIKGSTIDLSNTKEGIYIGGNFNLDSFTSNIWLNDNKIFKVDHNFTVSNTTKVWFNETKVDIGENFTVTNTNVEMHTNESFKVGGNFVLGTGAAFRTSTGVGINGGEASADNANFYVGGKIYIGGYNEFFTNARNGGKMFISSAGINGNYNMGFVWQNGSGPNEVTHILRNADTSEMITNFFFWDDAGDATSRLNFIMNGAGTQIMRIGDDAGDRKWNWKGKVTVNNGQFILGNTNSATVDVEVGSNGSFGVTGNAANVNVGNVYIQDFIIRDGGKIIFNVENGVSSDVLISKSLTVDGMLNIVLKGDDISEGDQFTLMTWNDEYDTQNKAALDGAFASDSVSLYINGVEYEIENWSTGDNKFNISIGAAIPEPSTVAFIVGMLALGAAAYRRRK